jgi:hypothetical protein
MFKALSGAVDGLNATFGFGQAYTPGSTAIFLNGQLLMSGSLPWMEADPSTGYVELVEVIPRTGDVVTGFALDTSPVAPETEISPLSAILEDVPTGLAGLLETPTALVGLLDDVDQLMGLVGSQARLMGIVDDGDALVGILEVC